MVDALRVISYGGWQERRKKSISGDMNSNNLEVPTHLSWHGGNDLESGSMLLLDSLKYQFRWADLAS